jgi:hypothetical protein
MKETNVMQRIRLHLGQSGQTKIFRNNVGMGWTGRVVKNPDGSITIHEPRPLHAGLCEGSSDLIGWTTVTVSPEMVGKRLALFTAIEVKSATGAPSPAQRNFIGAVRDAGGRAGVARDHMGAQLIAEGKV